MNGKYDDVELTEQEIAAMKEALGAEEGVEPDDTEAGTDTGTDDQDSTSDTDTSGAAEDSGPDEETSADDEPQKDESKADEGADATAQEPVAPAQQAQDAQPQEPKPSRLEQLNADLLALRDKFDSGDIAVDEYIDARDLISRQIVKVELAQELAKQEVERGWERSQREFFKQHPYLRENEVIYDAYSSQVNRMLRDPASSGMTDEGILSAAKAKVDAAFGRTSEPEPSKDERPGRQAKQAAADVTKAPKTLRGIPVAEAATDTDGGKYSYLDRLAAKGGQEFEAALAKLSSDELAAWAHS